jgi:predicted unusual protein kinase regulating ubiquinone biosynthesis (AarF/ABC1/UbiB family)
MVGRLSPEIKQGLRDLAIAVGGRDPGRLMKAYQELGVLLPGADLERIRQAETALLDQVWGKNMRELIRLHPSQMREFVRQFQDLLFEMPFQVPNDLIFLGRCVAILSGMCTGLDPEFNLFAGLAPFAQQLLAEEGGDWLDTLVDWLTKQGGVLVGLPGRVVSTLAKIERGDLVVTARADPGLERELRSLSRSANRLVAAVVFAALLLAGTLLTLNGNQLLGRIGLGLALLALAWMLLGLG